jgi:mRNA-degrading endonuclease RelE of RelBE toxin-antitoxin system
MASYSIVYKPSVEKDLCSLPRTTVMRVMKRIDIRVGDYRVIYGIDEDAKQVTVHYVRHRRDAYR